MTNLYSYLTRDREMKLFISWSGEKSKAVAILIRNWISDIIQAIDPWMSEKDIDRGAIWFSEISKVIENVTVSIICVTKENKNKPWVLFEAGALSGGESENRVCTFLVDLEPSEIQQPLAQFNHTVPTKESLYELLKTLNSKITVGKLNEQQLNRIFEKNWLDFEKQFNEILDKYPTNEVIKEKTPQEEMLEEILYTVRSIERKVGVDNTTENVLKSLGNIAAKYK